MFKTIKSWFKVQPLVTAARQSAQQDVTDRMVGEPVLSFVKCLKANPKRFKLKSHSRKHVDSTDLWPVRYHWMDDQMSIGYWSLEDRKDGSMYYAIQHKGRIYSIKGLNFSLNAWETKHICDAFFKFRLPARERLNKMSERKWEEYRKKEAVKESLERLLLKEKFV